MKTKNIAAVLLSVLMVFSLAACGAVKKEADIGRPESVSSLTDAYRAGNSYSQKAEEGMEFSLSPSYDSKDGLTGFSTDTSKTGSLFPADVKLIYRANASVQTADFEKAEESLKAAVAAAGGYFESQSVYSGDYYNRSALRRGEYTLRIPADNYRSFVDGLGSYAVVTNLKETVDDVGQVYYETEARLKTLYTKEERLQELLKKAEGLNDIIQLENALSDTEYAIDQYQSELNRYDSLIGYSTISLSLQEVSRPEEGIGEKNGFFAVLGRRFVAGLADTGLALENFAYWISGNFVPLVLCAAAAIFLRKKHPVRKLRAKIAAGRTKKPGNGPTDENK